MKQQEKRVSKKRRLNWAERRFPKRLSATKTIIIFLTLFLILGASILWFKSLLDETSLSAATSEKPSYNALSFLPEDSLRTITSIQSLFSDYSRNALASSSSREVWLYTGSSAAFHKEEMTQLMKSLTRLFPQKNEIWVECFPVSRQSQSERYLGFSGRWVKRINPADDEPVFVSIDEIEEDNREVSIFQNDEENIKSLSANRLAYYYFAYASSTTKARLYGEKLTSEFEIATNHQLMEFLKWRGALYEIEGNGIRRRIECNPDSLRKLPLPSLHLLSQRFSAPTFEDEITFQPKDYLTIRRSLALNIERILSEEIPID